MAKFLLIRHGNTDMVDKVLAGRMPGVRLNEEGIAQAAAVAERLSSLPLSGIFSSPLERTIETARPIALKHSLEIEIRSGLIEVETGEWTGMRMADLDSRTRWQLFNSFRTGTRIPGGETILEVQKRMVEEIETLRGNFPEGVIAVVSHGDPIKTVIAYYAGIPLDFWGRITIGTGSVSVLQIEDWGASVLCLNHTGQISI
ncbi:MAG: histidine phosphatase family protein [Syntrophobacteraceae bacterium]